MRATWQVGSRVPGWDRAIWPQWGWVMDPRLDSVDDDLVTFRVPAFDDEDSRPQRAPEPDPGPGGGYRFVAPGELPWPTRRAEQRHWGGRGEDTSPMQSTEEHGTSRVDLDWSGPLRPRRAWIVAVVSVCLLAAAFVVGRATAGPKEADPVGPRSRDGAVPRGFAHTKAGAEAAAANYAVLVATPALADPDSMRATLAAVAAPGADFDTAASAAVEGLGARLGESGVALDDKVVFRTFPLTANSRRYSDTLADVEVWVASVLAVDGTRPATAAFVTYKFALTWTGGDWRVEDLTVRATAADPAVAPQLVDFTPLQYAPARFGGVEP